MLSALEVEQIVEIIHQHVGAILLLTLGIVPSDLDVKGLKESGIISGDVPEELIKDAYVYGVLKQMHPGMGFEELMESLSKYMLSESEKNAVSWLSENAALYVKGLGNKIVGKTVLIAHDMEKEEALKGKIRDSVIQSIVEHKTRSQAITALRDVTGDVQRDMHRVINTELHNAHTQGSAKYIRDNFGEDAFVFVRPNRDACKVCKAAYLGADGKPKIFRLSEISSRDNVGRSNKEKISEPGLPTLHPFCACQVFRIDPDTQEIDDNGQLVFKM